ncbi:hypothetical protein V3C99_013967 [Haemonchus contortus]
MLPRWLLVPFIINIAAADDGGFVSAMKSLLFGTEQHNTSNNAHLEMHPSPSASGSPVFHQFAVAQQQASGQACMMPQQIGTGPYRIPRWYFNPARGRCELFYWSGCCGNGNNFQTFQSCQSACEVDPCTLDKESGVGSVQIVRFYFNKRLKLCEEFVYFGAGGNRNNFLTLEECQAKCPESPNPCAVTVSIPGGQCTPGVSSCGGGSFCHVGANAQTTTCCPKPAPIDRCQQPLNVGIGNAQLQRWYFNPLTQQCQPCIYRGLQGNENNFLSKQDCENSCLVNACKLGSPYRSQGVIVQCSAANPTVCPAGHYCHYGADTTTSVCCQALGNNPCAEPWTKGEGNSALTRFYYDAVQRKCLAFNYLGLKGNQNNFLTKEACEALCPVWVNPCAVGQPILTPDQRPFHCNQNAPCSSGYYCHIGFDESTTVCCQSEGDPCSLVVKEGHGSQSLNRWFYNHQTRQCQPFTYRGLGGNENNFLLREHCEVTCPVWVNACPKGDAFLLPNGRPQHCNPTMEDSCPQTHWCHPGPDEATTMCCPGRTDTCMSAKAEGEGPLQLIRYYFDAPKRQCVQFTFRGIRGSPNNFLTKESCEARCPVQINPCPLTLNSLKFAVTLTTCSKDLLCPDKHWCHIGETKETTVCCPSVLPDPCMAPARNPGEGTYHATRWAFDGATRKCVPFEYRGLRGNANNFISREACERQCPVFENPCKLSEPYSVFNKYYTCGSTNTCPSQHYCHIGVDTNYCCPVLSGDPCSQPMDRGVGMAQLQRWYWNGQSQTCVQFSYCGMKGTQNNFLSKQDCERTCYVLDNPCALGPPQMGLDNRPITCSVGMNTCGASFWCHFGANQQTTVCCPGRVDGQAVCRQPLALGTGEAALPRWYYDASTMRCVQFFYRGRYGNQNNFLSQHDCEQTCPVYVNVCPVGSPLLDSSNHPVPCTFGANSCGADHWCHLGLVPDEYQCCPGEPTVPGACQGMPEEHGELGAPAPPTTRYYYDPAEMVCKPFIYNGRKGNQNNFLTLEDCEQTCNVFVNPCNKPISLPPQLCNPGGPDMCGPNAWCHVGASPDTTLCCPSEGDPCSLPLLLGEGNQFMDRWYYNQQSGSCQPFTYGGLHGNQNNFLTKEACDERCGPNPCFEGRPFVGVDGRPQTCSISANLNTCPANYWCHIGVDMSTTVCCPGASINVCNLPMSTGEGNYNLERYYFDQSTKTCRPFIYNGLKGNQNNFITLRACQLSCQPLDNPCIGQPATTAAGQVLFCSSTNKDTCPVNFWCHLGATPETTVCCPGATNPCSVPLAPGTGNAGLARWYYNPDDRQCFPFQYNGKRGNQNNFETQAECERTCPEELCLLSIDRGACGGRQTRYAFNRQTSQCVPFDYTGCGGNLNNFVSMMDCMATCGNVGFRR